MDLVSDVITKSTVSGKLVSTPLPPSNLPPARILSLLPLLSYKLNVYHLTSIKLHTILKNMH